MADPLKLRLHDEATVSGKVVGLDATNGCGLDDPRFEYLPAGELLVTVRVSPGGVVPVLADLRERLVKADAEIKALAADSDGPGRIARLQGKSQGVRLALSYLDEVSR